MSFMVYCRTHAFKNEEFRYGLQFKRYKLHSLNKKNIGNGKKW